MGTTSDQAANSTKLPASSDRGTCTSGPSWRFVAGRPGGALIHPRPLRDAAARGQRQLADPVPLDLVLEGGVRHAKVAAGRRDVAVALLQGADDQVALEGPDGIREPALAARRLGLEADQL